MAEVHSGNRQSNLKRRTNLVNNTKPKDNLYRDPVWFELLVDMESFITITLRSSCSSY